MNLGTDNAPVVQLVVDLRARGVELWVEADRLRYRAPNGAMSGALREAVASRKQAIIAHLRAEASASVNEAPLSHNQQAPYLLHGLAPDSAAYNVGVALRIRSALDLDALRNALQGLIDRHPLLRTTYRMDADGPVQLMRGHADLALSAIDVTGQDAATLRETVERAYRVPFDLEHGPVMRALLFTGGPDTCVLLLMLHHVMCDAASVSILIEDLLVGYAKYTGREDRLLPTGRPYVDFVRWQHDLVAGPDGDRLWSYWSNQLAGPLPVLELATDHPRPPHARYRGASCPVTIDPALDAALRRLAKSEGTTLYTVLLAAFQTLLCRLSGQEEIVVGSPTRGRPGSEFDRTVGCFINPVAIRATVSGDPTFREFLATVRTTVVGALSHADYPFPLLARRLLAARDTGRSPVFQALFNLIKMPDEPLAADRFGLAIEPFDFPQQEGQFELALELNDTGRGLHGMIRYATDLYDEGRIREMALQLGAVLTQVVDNPDARLAALDLGTQAARRVLPDPAFPLAGDFTGSIVERFGDHARRTPDQVAVAWPGGRWTYAELDRLSDRLAADLRSRGIGVGDVVAVYAHRSAALVLTLVGVMKAGAAFSILNPEHPADRLAACLRVSKARAFIHIAGAGKLARELDQQIDGLCRIQVGPDYAAAQAGARGADLGSANDPAGAGLHAPVGATDPDRLAYVIFTSGSTGGVKAIAGSERPLAHFLSWHATTFGLTASDSFSLLSGLGHDPMLRDVFTPLWVGGRLEIPPPCDLLEAETVARWMAQSGVRVAHLTPQMARLIAEAASARDVRLPSLRYVFFGGDVLRAPAVDEIRGIAPRAECVNFYGATETPQAMAFWRVPNDGDASPTSIPVGRGIDAVQLLVLTECGRLAGVGEPGEICVRTPYLSRGYWDDADLTRDRFPVNPFTGAPKDRIYRTGDIGRYRPDGAVEFVGRRDFQVKIRGFRVELREVEEALASHPSVAHAVAVARPDQRGDLQVAAFWVSGSPHALPSVAALRAYLRATLPEYAVPARIERLDRLPVTANGKIDRAALPVTPVGAEAGDRLKTRPRSRIEEMVAGIWAEVLGVARVGPHDSFFDLGGHSLLAGRLIRQLNDVFWVDLPLRTLFECPTVAGISEVIVRRMKETRSTDRIEDASVQMINANGSRHPFFFFHAALEGDGFYCFNLARHLGPDQPMYAIAPLGLDGGQVPATIEEMARAHIRTIKRLHADGPYYLGGFCASGPLVFEMAQQLTAAGDDVPLVVVVESQMVRADRLSHYIDRASRVVGLVPWIHPRHRVLLAAVARYYGIRVREVMRRGPRAVGRSVARELLRAASRMVPRVRVRRRSGVPGGTSPATTPPAEGLRFRDLVSRHLALAILAYVARPYPGEVACMWAEQTELDTEAWRMVAPRVRLQTVPGGHQTCITTRVEHLGAAIRDALHRAQARGRQAGCTQSPAGADGPTEAAAKAALPAHAAEPRAALTACLGSRLRSTAKHTTLSSLWLSVASLWTISG